MDPQQQFCLKWNSFGNNLVSTFDNLFKSESLTDVTLFCEGVTFKAHKVILAACSKHFQELFEAAGPHCPSVIVILDGTSSANMSALLEFMYKGEVHVSHESLSSFLKAAECLQVKGLSIEQHKLVEAHSQVSRSDERVESPKGGSSSSSERKGAGTSGNSKDTVGGASSDSAPPAEHPASTSSAPPYAVMSPYAMHHYMQVGAAAAAAFSDRYDGGARKRVRMSPDCGGGTGGSGSGSAGGGGRGAARASVLRDGSKAAGGGDFSPHHSPPSSHYHSPASYETGPPSSGDSPQPPYDSRPPPTTGAANSAAVESDTPPPDLWRSACPQDLSVKVEPPGSERSVVTVKSEWSYSSGGGGSGGGGGGSGVGSEREAPESNHPPEILPSNVWNCSSSTKISQAHKQVPTATTPDGKKLQCPFCERLYGYETNLRAHIRQRHQGIRVPCPFCSRTFTRNNTVRRHIAREHKTELSLKAFQPPSVTQVHNHNQ